MLFQFCEMMIVRASQTVPQSQPVPLIISIRLYLYSEFSNGNDGMGEVAGDR